MDLNQGSPVRSADALTAELPRLDGREALNLPLQPSISNLKLTNTCHAIGRILTKVARIPDSNKLVTGVVLSVFPENTLKHKRNTEI